MIRKRVTNDFINTFLLKVLVCIFLFLIFLICNKKVKNFNKIIYDNFYNSNFSFAKINNWYESNFGFLFPIKKIEEVQVFNEQLSYKTKEKYKEGVLLKVNDNYLVPSLSNGIVIFIGDKEGLGRTIIVEDENEVDIWYSNINILNINLYDYVNKGDYLAEAIDGKIIMIFQRKGKYLDYNKYV